MTLYARTFAFALFAASIVMSTAAVAQTEESRRRPEPGEMREGGPQNEIVTFEPFFRSLTADSVDVDILFRIRHDALVFERSATSGIFNAQAEISIEIIDSTESSLARHIETLALTSPDNTQASLQRSDDQGLVSFHLKRGRYFALCIVADKQAEHKQFMRRIPLMIPRTHGAVSSALLAQAFDTLSGLTPCNIGGNAMFDRPLFVAVAVPAERHVKRAIYSLEEFKPEESDHPAKPSDTTVVPTLLSDTSIEPMVDSLHHVVYRLVRRPGTDLVVLSLNGERLDQGRYMLRLRFDAADTASMRFGFAVRWIDMPQSLRDLDFATAAMKYITTDEEYDNLTSGRRSKRIAAFEAFWKKQDPTPGTAYNERMAEYFRRVDYAAQNFRTLKEDNGALTDRGKIYILYGRPSETERSLSPSNAPRELWRYPALKKQFTFEDISRQGNYKLIQTDNQ